MDKNKYLEAVLKTQVLGDNGDELKELQAHRVDVEDLLRNAFSECSPTIRYGGSKAKGTLIKESYDLDIICYFPHDDTSAGETLEDIHNNVRDALAPKYYVEDKTSAIRLKSRDVETYARDFHIDVVPGRYTDDTKTDAFLYQASGEKKRRKTNLDVHIAHVKNSGVLEAIRLLKLWKVRRTVSIRQFAFELVVIELLRKKKTASLADQLEHVWTELKNNEEPIAIEDPANPTGNDLSDLLKGAWPSLSAVASSTLASIESLGWESAFGPVESASEKSRVEVLRSAAAAVSTPTKPWATR